MEKASTLISNPSFGFMAEDAEGGIWICTDTGLAHLPDGQDRFSTFPKQSLNAQTLHNIMIDREQNIWLATDRGLYKISKAKVINYAEAEGIANNRVTSVCETKPGQFLLTSVVDSLYWLKDGRITPYRIHNPAAFRSVLNIKHCLTDNKGNTWCAHQSGLLKLSSGGEIDYPLNGQARYVAEGYDGRIYAGVAYKGIACINERNEVTYLNFPKIDFSQTYISSIHQLRDTSWLVTTYRTGAMIIDKKGDAYPLDLTESLLGVQVFDAFEAEDGTLWFATGKGLVRYMQGRAQLVGTESGLPEPGFFGILRDNQGRWWFPTNKGIFYAPYAQLEAYLQNKSNTIDWKFIDDSDGMNNRQCVGARHSMVGSDGKLYVPSIGGLVVVDPTRIQSNPTPPLVTINSLQVDDSVHFNRSTISPGNHRYIFDYSALSFVAPERNQVRFRLVGRDKAWVQSKGDNRAFYTDLGPGDYRFELMASNNDGVWTDKPAVFHFTVQPFFYQTTWFRILAALLLIGIVWMLIWWRTRAALAKSAWLEDQVSQRTAELRNSLTQLQSAQAQLIQSEKMASLGELTAGIAHEIQNPLNFVNNFSEVNAELTTELTQAAAKGDLQEVQSLASSIKENEEKIIHHGKRADAIVKGMLQHSRKSSGQKEPTDLNALCDEYLRLAYHGLRAKDKSFNAKFETRLDPTLPRINVVPQEIGRVILNLINNAFYAVSEKAKQQAASYQPQVTVITKNLGDKIKISVSDNGPGIPESIKDKIFQPFFTTKPTGQGTGLGLSLSYDIVKAHAGELSAETREGGGTEFFIHLPIITSGQ
jgi:signal transduction histidine kinase